MTILDGQRVQLLNGKGYARGKGAVGVVSTRQNLLTVTGPSMFSVVIASPGCNGKPKSNVIQKLFKSRVSFSLSMSIVH